MQYMNTPHETVRVTVPVRPEVLEAFKRMAEVGSMSTGKAMGEWLFDTLDGVVAMVDLMEKARQAPREVVMELHSYALGLTDMTTELMDQVRSIKAAQKVMNDAGLGAKRPLVPKPASVTSLKAKAASKKGRTPPVGNTGGKLPSKPQKSVRGKNV